MNDIQLTLLVIGLVSIARRWVPRIDGPLVAVVAVLFAAIAAVAADPCQFPADLARGLVSGLAGFGLMSAVRYAVRKLDCLCKSKPIVIHEEDDDRDFPPTLDTNIHAS